MKVHPPTCAARSHTSRYKSARTSVWMSAYRPPARLVHLTMPSLSVPAVEAVLHLSASIAASNSGANSEPPRPYSRAGRTTLIYVLVCVLYAGPVWVSIGTFASPFGAFSKS